MTKRPSNRREKPPKVSHYGWPDLLIIGGGLVVVPVAVLQQRWHFLFIGVGLIAIVIGRILFTQWLEKKAKK